MSPAVSARDLSLHGGRGTVYGPLDIDIDPGTLTIVQGPQGSGRTALLLTLAGRMKPDRETRELTVLGLDLPRQRREVQRLVAIAGFKGIDELDDSVTVRDMVRERLGWLSRWYRPRIHLDESRYAALAAPVFGDRILPGLDEVVWDLDELDQMLLRITIAMAQEPRMLVVDDLDHVHDSERREYVWQRLGAMSAAGLTVIGAVASASDTAHLNGAGHASQVIELQRPVAGTERN